MDHVLHPHIETRKKSTEIEAKPRGFNDWLAIKITNIVGTMWCAYAFTALTLLSLPDAIKGGRGPLVAWVAQTFLQLVLLSIIMVGQKVDAAASDKRARRMRTPRRCSRLATTSIDCLGKIQALPSKSTNLWGIPGAADRKRQLVRGHESMRQPATSIHLLK
jgi:hypothetical protein